MLPLMSRRFEVLDPRLYLQIPPCRFSQSVFVCTRVRGNVTQLQRERARLLRWRFAETSRQGLQTNGENKLQHSVIITREERGGRHKRRSWLVPIHQPSIFPLTHGTQMKTDFKGEDEKHSLLKAKCFTCANTVVLSEKWTTVKLANRCASHTKHESYAVEYMEKA